MRNHVIAVAWAQSVVGEPNSGDWLARSAILDFCGLLRISLAGADQTELVKTAWCSERGSHGKRILPSLGLEQW